MIIICKYEVQPNAALIMDTSLVQTPHYYTQFALSLGKENPHIISKFNPLNMDTFYGPLSVHINRV